MQLIILTYVFKIANGSIFYQHAIYLGNKRITVLSLYTSLNLVNSTITSCYKVCEYDIFSDKTSVNNMCLNLF